MTILSHVSEAQTVSYFRVSGVVGGIAAGPDGNLWFLTGAGVVKMTPWGRMVTYRTPTLPNGGPRITAGPDGRMWFTMAYQDRIGAITMDGKVTEYQLAPQTSPFGITGGSDSNVWFGYYGGVGRITPAGGITLFPLPPGPTPARPSVGDIVEGPDRNFWFVEEPDNRIGRITPTGALTEFPVCCGSSSIARADDGGLWISFGYSGKIGRLSTDGRVTVFPVGLDTRVVSGGPGAMIWFGTTRSGTHASASIGSVSQGGNVHVIDMPPEIPTVIDITRGPDGNIWATLNPPFSDCTLICPPPDPNALPPLGIARVNLNTAADPLAIPALNVGYLFLMVMVLAGVGVLELRS